MLILNFTFIPSSYCVLVSDQHVIVPKMIIEGSLLPYVYEIARLRSCWYVEVEVVLVKYFVAMVSTLQFLSSNEGVSIRIIVRQIHLRLCKAINR